MPNIVAIVSDDRVRRQVEQYIGQFGSDDIRLVTFKSAKEFESLYFPDGNAKPAAQPAPPEPEKDSGPVDLRLVAKIHVIVFAIDSIVGKASTWCSMIMKKTKDRYYWPENNRTRMILLKYEDDNNSKLDVLLQEIDDLIYIPLDRLLFQQKLDVVLGLPKKAKGRFMFSQNINAEIEISKITRLEKFSDVGLAVRNPLPIRSGIRAKFYMQLPGDKDTIRFFAKSIRSVPHPELKDQYLCYFSFFGLRKKDTSKIRQWLSKSHSYKLLLKEDRTKFKLNPRDLMKLESAGPVRNVVVIDPHEDQLNNIASLIKTELDHVQVVTNTSYGSFLHHYVKHAPDSQRLEPPKPTRAEDLYGGSVQLQLELNRRAIKTMNFTPGEEKVLGFTGQDVFKNGGVEWWAIFASEENDLILQEALDLLKEKKTTRKVIVIRNAGGERCAVRIKITPNEDPELFNIEISPPPSRQRNGRHFGRHVRTRGHGHSGYRYGFHLL